MWQLIFGGIQSIVSGAIAPLFTWLNKKEDTTVEKYKVDGVVNVEAMRQDTEIIKARTELAAAMKDDPVNKWGRRLLIYPTGVWYSLIVYDSCFRMLLPDFTWKVLALPTSLEYVPHAVVAYLLITAWKK